MINPNCPVCGSVVKANNLILNRRDDEIFDCPVCGRFEISGPATINIQNLVLDGRKAAVLSHAIRRMQKSEKKPYLSSEIVDGILREDYLPYPLEQADNLILWIGNASKIPGESVALNLENLRSEIGSATKKNANFILQHLRDLNFVKAKSSNSKFALTFSGWEKYYHLKKETSENRRAFMAMPYGYQKIDEIYHDYFKEAVRKTGFELYRLDEKPKAGSIDDRLRVEIRKSRFLIADLTNGNQGVYWEAGFAEGLKKPVIYTCEKEYFDKDKTHFDTNHLHTVVWEEGKYEDASKLLTTTIRATIPDEAIMEDNDRAY